MAIQHINAISNRLSLRPPQRDSLEILARVCEIVSLAKDADPAVALEAIKSEFGTVGEFERGFPSLCFALATGVGKTRLMGAFITYLFQAEGIRNFFVLAPNLTIYNKLITDFTPNTSKYVFKGIGEFAINPPVVITGDTYESATAARGQLFDNRDDCHINIFNISKINSEVRGGNAPRIKRLSEYIGQSYFDYLAGLDDLVMLMDESHRYRASAGVRAINELKPILGLELTATPQVERGQRSEPFKNVIYSYPLSAAMTDGFVKEPAVATRENFDANAYSPEGLEKVKLEDGVRIHENTKVELEVYGRNNDKDVVKPFMLVVATDTEHANALQQVIESDEFFEGRYKGKVIQVHSNLRGEVKDEVVEQLLTVEHPDNPVEIVIHVNMLKEGWDVTNLYTIVPLRAANSRTLVEQSIGRGLRLPYGKRVGVPAVDRLVEPRKPARRVLVIGLLIVGLLVRSLRRSGHVDPEIPVVLADATRLQLGEQRRLVPVGDQPGVYQCISDLHCQQIVGALNRFGCVWRSWVVGHWSLHRMVNSGWVSLRCFNCFSILPIRSSRC
jgi:type III restriction enzyme